MIPSLIQMNFPSTRFEFPYVYWCARLPVTNRQFLQFATETKYLTLAEKLGWAYVFVPGMDEWHKTEGADWRHPTGPDSGIEELLDHPSRLDRFL